MAHVSYVEPDEAPEAVRPIYDAVSRKLGLVLNFLRALAQSPPVLSGFVALDGAQAQMELDPALREIAYLRASELNGCDYCRSYHHGFARRAGVTERQVNELDQAAHSDAFDARQRAVLRYAEALTRRATADPALIADLKAFLSDRALVELTATIALANYTNRINNALAIELP
jgi:uncharacterized peroxidase-related enzyme